MAGFDSFFNKSDDLEREIQAGTVSGDNYLGLDASGNIVKGAAGGGGGAAINATNNRVPFRQSGTAFGDSQVANVPAVAAGTVEIFFSGDAAGDPQVFNLGGTTDTVTVNVINAHLLTVGATASTLALALVPGGGGIPGTWTVDDIVNSGTITITRVSGAGVAAANYMFRTDISSTFTTTTSNSQSTLVRGDRLFVDGNIECAGSISGNLDVSQVTAGTLLAANGGTGLTATTTLLNSNTTPGDLGTLPDTLNDSEATYGLHITDVGGTETVSWNRISGTAGALAVYDANGDIASSAFIEDNDADMNPLIRVGAVDLVFEEGGITLGADMAYAQAIQDGGGDEIRILQPAFGGPTVTSGEEYQITTASSDVGVYQFNGAAVSVFNVLTRVNGALPSVLAAGGTSVFNEVLSANDHIVGIGTATEISDIRVTGRILMSSPDGTVYAITVPDGGGTLNIVAV